MIETLAIIIYCAAIPLAFVLVARYYANLPPDPYDDGDQPVVALMAALLWPLVAAVCALVWLVNCAYALATR